MIQICVISKGKNDLNSITSLLSAQDDFTIADTGHNGYDAIKIVSRLCPDIIVMDLYLDDISGPELAPIIKMKSPATKLIAISSRNDMLLISRALRAEFAGFLVKHADMDKLTNAIRSVLHGGYYLSTPARHHAYYFLSGIDSLFMGETAPKANVTDNEGLPDIPDIGRKIMNRIAKGYSDKEIADELGIAPGTVRNCLAAIKRKTGHRNRTQMIIYSLLHGLIDLP